MYNCIYKLYIYISYTHIFEREKESQRGVVYIERDWEKITSKETKW